MYSAPQSRLAAAGNEYSVLSALIVDDEDRSRRNLATLLEQHCTGIAVAGLSDSAEHARTLVQRIDPDVLFLDIRMPGSDGFDLLESLENLRSMVVFVTAHDNYGIRAVKAAAIDYLLKPVSITELRSTVDRLHSIRRNRQMSGTGTPAGYEEALVELKRALLQGATPQRIVLPTDKTLLVEDVANIVRAESHNNYIAIIRNGGRDVVVSRSLTEFESILDADRFIRIHNSHLINLAYLTEFDMRDGGTVLLRGGTRLPVSRRRQPLLLEKLKRFQRL